ncbi:MAG: HAMP domain-containing histidine kinase [Ruminococcaceae bacterium]|nr:HAMP domain-containing histidine kinase [Oscillospiraceae bacterium]
MKKGFFFLGLFLAFAAEIAALLLFSAKNTDSLQDSVTVNEAVQSVRADWNTIEEHKNTTSLDYVVINNAGEVLYRTSSNLSEGINAAVINRDTILDIEIDGSVVGKIIVFNDSIQTFGAHKQIIIAVFAVAAVIQCGICIGYVIYLEHTVIKPFGKLKGFAERIAGGNLDIPLEMDRRNLFGAFTESFDIMRSDLKKARIAEAKANASKKELVVKLSHDIKTPVASIKAASEVGAALTESDTVRNNYIRIIRKADQINTLVTNLFSATLEELQQLSVVPADLESGVINDMLESADYFHYAQIPDIPECLIFADRLRLQQVFDNIFANSYKYANTEIYVKIFVTNNFLSVEIEDLGGGVKEEELPLLKEKFKRGSNVKGIEGAGLGLYISDCFMKEMNGELTVENGQSGLKITVYIPLSGNV